MSLVLNIGRRVDSTGTILPASHVYAALEAHQLEVLSSVHVQSDTEPTLVVEVERWHEGIGVDAAQASMISRLSAALGQDCIATWDPSEGHGLLLGPRADAWGVFNPGFFVGLDGHRLSDTLAAPLCA